MYEWMIGYCAAISVTMTLMTLVIVHLGKMILHEPKVVRFMARLRIVDIDEDIEEGEER